MCVIFLLLAFLGRFFCFTSNAILFKGCFGHLGIDVTLFDASVTYRYYHTFTFLAEGSDEILDNFLVLKDFVHPNELFVEKFVSMQQLFCEDVTNNFFMEGSKLIS
jgi:hypothetical protein